MKKIYLIGRINGSYRSQNIISILIKNNYSVFFDSGSNYLDGIKRNSIWDKILIKIIREIDALLEVSRKIFMLCFSDIVILLAMNNAKKWELNLAKFLKKKIITDYYISLYDTQVLDRKNVSLKSLRAKKILKSDRRIVDKANEVIFLNKVEAERYLKLIDRDLKDVNYRIIPLCIDKKDEVKMPFFNKKQDFITICWWGTYIPLHGLEKIIDAMVILKKENIKFKLYLFGNNKCEGEKYKNIIKELKLEEDIVIIDDYTFSNGKLGEFLVNNCDLVLGNFGESEKAKAVLVNKIIDGIAMKAPVLNGESSAPDEFFDYSNDIWKTNNDPQSIAKKIKSIYSENREEILRRVENSYKIYEKNFSEKAFEDSILSMIKEVE